MDLIGKYKGYEVYKIPQKQMKRTQEKGIFFAVEETGELVLNGEVVAKVNFETGHVKDYDDHRCYSYRYKEGAPTRGKRAETVTVDDVLGSQVVDPTDLDKMINDFILAAREMEISDLVGEFKEA